MQKISEVKLGQKLTSPKNEIGLVCDTTKKSITVIWESGLKIKNTYRDTSAPFYVSDFF